MESNAVYANERITDTYIEVEDIVCDYFAHTVAGDDMPPLNFEWSQYIDMERRGQLLLVTARSLEDGAMIGFVMYMVSPHPHHRDVIHAFSDMIGVRPAHRHKGIGSRLLYTAEGFLRHGGVHRIIQAFRETYADTTPLFERHGYKQVERIYAKDLSPWTQRRLDED